jgi:hypothetical protein
MILAVSPPDVSAAKERDANSAAAPVKPNKNCLRCIVLISYKLSTAFFEYDSAAWT